jgi:HD-GYP domain-containing protein (c-di-GMP phosphodiesterase class II)
VRIVSAAFPLGPFAEPFGLTASTAEVRDGALVSDWRERVHPEDVDTYDALAARWCAGEVAEDTYRLAGEDGAVSWVRHRGHPRMKAKAPVVDMLAMDVTDLHVAREQAGGAIKEPAARALALAGVLHERFPQIHADQVSSLAAATAGELGLPRSATERVRLAGLLHDVGKIAIPESILSKPGPLDAAERALIDRHPELGAELVRYVPGLEGAVAGIRHHHERYDGAGYPDGLAGTEIPIDARIVAAVDTYSAITTDRPYQRATSHTMALAELRSCSGNQLDPVVVEALCRVVVREADFAAERLAS